MNINFTDSELYLIEDIIKEDKERFVDVNDFDKIIINEYNSILDKIKIWKEIECKKSEAIKILNINKLN